MKATSVFVETYRGCVNAWECDEMGHMNVRHYVSKWSEGMASLAEAMGLNEAFTPRATSTIAPIDQHIRFLAEARPGAPLSMRACVLGFSRDTAEIYQELLHADGRPAAAFSTLVAHIDPSTGRAFPWPKRVTALATELMGERPGHGAPRSIDMSLVPGDASRARAEELGMTLIGRGAARMDEMDNFGRARPDLFIGRVSDSVPNILSKWRQEAGEEKNGNQVQRLGGAVLEYRLVYRRWPGAGDLLQVYTGVVEAKGKIQRLVHWLVDGANGQPVCTCEAVATTFDLDTRKAIEPPQAHLDQLNARAIPGLSV
jgi:acyl-CoA thioester hydrolase